MTPRPRSRISVCFAKAPLATRAFAMVVAVAASTLGEPKPEATSRDTGSDLLWKKLETRVEEVATKLDGVMGVAILDLTDGRILLRNADRVFPAANSIKIAILLELYRQDQEARAELKEKPCWMIFTRLIQKIWSKTARSWLVSLLE